MSRRAKLVGVLAVLVLGLSGTAANADPELVVANGGAFAIASSGLSGKGGSCSESITMSFTAAGADTNPVGAYGKVRAMSVAACGGDISLGAHNLHLVVGGVDYPSYCSSSICSSASVEFGAGEDVRAYAFGWFDIASPVTWTAATPEYCTIQSATRTVCQIGVRFPLPSV